MLTHVRKKSEGSALSASGVSAELIYAMTHQRRGKSRQKRTQRKYGALCWSSAVVLISPNVEMQEYFMSQPAGEVYHFKNMVQFHSKASFTPFYHKAHNVLEIFEQI